MKYNILKIAVLAISMASCGLYSKHTTPNIENANSLAGVDKPIPDTAAVPVPSWQEVFTDKNLQDLITTALDTNSDLRTAALTVEEVQQRFKTSRLTFLPSFALAPEASIASMGGSNNIKSYNLPIQASWEIDIFGKLRNAKEQTRSLLQQSKDYEQLIKTQIIAAVASNYYALVLTDKHIEITQNSYDTMSETLEAMKALKEVGLTNETAIIQMSANLKDIYIALQDLNENFNIAQNNICLLLNTSPYKVKFTKQEDINLNRTLTSSISLAALSNRPDVRAAEMTLSQSFYGVNYARASLYPNIKLMGGAGFANAEGMVNPGKMLFTALGSITQPLFAAGALRSNLKIAKINYEKSLIGFEKILLTAGKEVNDALMQCETARRKKMLGDRQVIELSRAVEITKELMVAGQANYLEVLSAQNSYLSSLLGQTAGWYGYALGEINLYKALGGGL